MTKWNSPVFVLESGCPRLFYNEAFQGCRMEHARSRQVPQEPADSAPTGGRGKLAEVSGDIPACFTLASREMCNSRFTFVPKVCESYRSQPVQFGGSRL